MNVTYAHLCDYASISREGKLSAMGIFDSIQVPSLPSLHPLLYLAFEIELRPSEVGQTFKVGIALVDIDGKPVLQTEAQMTFEGTPTSGDTIKIPQTLAIQGMPLRAAGRYSFDIAVNGDHKKSVTFDVSMLVGQLGSGRGLQP